MTMFQDPLYVAIASRRFDRLSGLALLSVPVELDMIKEVLTTRGISATHEVIRQ
jgi:transposase-like protein